MIFFISENNMDTSNIESFLFLLNDDHTVLVVSSVPPQVSHYH